MWSIDACLYSYQLYLSVFSMRSFFLSILSFLSFYLSFLLFLSLSLFTTTPFHTIYHGGVYYFYPSIAFSSLWCPSKTAHWLTGCSATTSAQNVLVAPLSIPRKNCLSCFLPLSVFTPLIQIRVKLPHYLPLCHALSGPSPYLPLLGEMSSQQNISPKEA